MLRVRSLGRLGSNGGGTRCAPGDEFCTTPAPTYTAIYTTAPTAQAAPGSSSGSSSSQQSSSPPTMFEITGRCPDGTIQPTTTACADGSNPTLYRQCRPGVTVPIDQECPPESVAQETGVPPLLLGLGSAAAVGGLLWWFFFRRSDDESLSGPWTDEDTRNQRVVVLRNRLRRASDAARRGECREALNLHTQAMRIRDQIDLGLPSRIAMQLDKKLTNVAHAIEECEGR